MKRNGEALLNRFEEELERPYKKETAMALFHYTASMLYKGAGKMTFNCRVERWIDSPFCALSTEIEALTERTLGFDYYLKPRSELERALLFAISKITRIYSRQENLNGDDEEPTDPKHFFEVVKLADQKLNPGKNKVFSKEKRYCK